MSKINNAQEAAVAMANLHGAAGYKKLCSEWGHKPTKGGKKLFKADMACGSCLTMEAIEKAAGQ